MDFSGEISSSKSLEETVSLLKDFSTIAQCLPGLDTYDTNGDEYICKIKLDVSQLHNSYLSTLSGRLKAKYIEASETKIVVNATGRVAGSSLKIRIDLSPTVKDGAVIIPWVAEVDFGMLMRVLGTNSISSVAQQNIEAIVNCMSKKLI